MYVPVSQAAKAAPVARAAAAKKPPKIEQNGSKWFIENHDGNRELKVTDGNAKTAICLVACTKSLLQATEALDQILDKSVRVPVIGYEIKARDLLNRVPFAGGF